MAIISKLSTCSVEIEGQEMAFWRQGQHLGTLHYQDSQKALESLNQRAVEVGAGDVLRIHLQEDIDLTRNDLEIIGALLSLKE